MDIPCVGAIVKDSTGRLLVVKRAHAPGAGLWSLPGGRVEPGETPQDAVRREVLEETGLDVDVGAPAGSVLLPAAGEGNRYAVTDYYATVRPGQPHTPVAGDDAADARWVTQDELHEGELTANLASTLQAWGVWS